MRVLGERDLIVDINSWSDIKLSAKFIADRARKRKYEKYSDSLIAVQNNCRTTIYLEY